MYSQDYENRELKELQSINKLINLKLNLRPGGFAGNLRCGEIESFQISFERCEWRKKSNWEWNGVPYARCADTESALSNGCVGTRLPQKGLIRWTQQTSGSVRVNQWSEVSRLTLNKEFEGNCRDFEFYSRINREPVKFWKKCIWRRGPIIEC